MPQLPTIAILTANRAYGAILEAVVVRPGWRVRRFDDVDQLAVYANIAQLSVLIIDVDLGANEPVPALISRLKALRGPALHTIATTRTLTGWTRAMCTAAGIDEVLIKPFSPMHLAERVALRAGSGSGRTGFGWDPALARTVSVSALRPRQMPTAEAFAGLMERMQPLSGDLLADADFSDKNVVFLAAWRKQHGSSAPAPH